MDTNFILTEAELVELTGYVLPSKQRMVLDGMGIRYSIRRDGHIRTTWPWLSMVQAKPIQEDIGFNLEALG
ncbi:DUF4224 domain-containing protein [uncultured Tolumonas sp.]|uniref:DUF4224 domain-containing protein n=1 Tax=uncultured Tolumonas sp. TaxID=263765 RepID=UPI002A0AA06D|nr:DUF4224 domain-containing protein [uncultured Tolumonas sp.]